MRRVIASIVLGMSVLLVGVANAAKWEVDKPHSKVQFKVTHMVISKVTGSFNDFDGVINFDEGDFSKGTVEFTVQTASVDTDNEKRNNHLKSDDFFNVEKFPTMTFKSTKVSKPNDGKFTITGDLTIRDVTKPVTFDCEYNGTMNDPWGNTRSGFSARATINRQDFGVSWNNTLDAGGLVVSDDVDIMLDLELVKAKEESMESGKAASGK